ncbi:hypothetical protein C3L33_09910, partial [Rhododendron williamsianum]
MLVAWLETTMDPRLYHSAKTGNTLLLIQLLDENPGQVLNLTPHENTPLHIAARFGNKNVVAEIYNRQKPTIGIEMLRLLNKAKNIALHEAVRNRHLRVVEFLIKVYPELAAPSSACGGSNGQTALHAAVVEGHFGNLLLPIFFSVFLLCQHALV